MDAEGWCYTGGHGGSVYVWSDACTVVKQIKCSNDMITVINAVNGKVLVGSKDKKVTIINAAGGNFSLAKFVNLDASFPKSLDFHEGNLLCGMRNGNIFEFKNVLENEDEPVTLMQSHYDGETWGINLVDGGSKILTSGDDNKISLINTETFKVERNGKVNGPTEMQGNYKDKKSTASSLGVYNAEN